MSFLNLGIYLSVLDYTAASERGLWMGRIQAISRIGTIVAVTVGSYLTDAIGFRSVVLVFGFLALLGALMSLHHARKPPVPVHSETRSGHDVSTTRATKQRSRTPAAGLLYVMAFIFGFVMNGIVAGTLSLLVLQRHGESVKLFGVLIGAATLSGLLLGTRWVCEILVGPLTGKIGDRLGTERSLPAAALLQAAALAALAFTNSPYLLIIVGLLVFAGGVALSISLHSVAGHVAITMRETDKVMSRYVTAQDLGSAVGPAVGYVVGLGMGLEGLYLLASVILVVMTIAFWRQVTRSE